VVNFGRNVGQFSPETTDAVYKGVTPDMGLCYIGVEIDSTA